MIDSCWTDGIFSNWGLLLIEDLGLRRKKGREGRRRKAIREGYGGIGVATLCGTWIYCTDTSLVGRSGCFLRVLRIEMYIQVPILARAYRGVHAWTSPIPQPNVT